MSEDIQVYKLGKDLPQVSENELHEALSIYNENSEDFDAEYTIVSYILDQFSREGKKSTSSEEINNKFAQLVVDFALSSLVKKGLIEPIFNEGEEIEYRLNDTGKDYIDNVLGNKLK